MKNKLLIALFGMMLAVTPITALAEDANLETRIEALEERVAALEAQLAGSVPAGVSATPDQVAGEVPELADVETGLISNGCSLVYKRCEVTKDYEGNDCVVLYFDYTNNSGETTSALLSYYVTIFQHDKQVEFTAVSDNKSFDDWSTEVRSGAATMEVANCFMISDTSDIIVEVESFVDSSIEPIEFTLSLE